MVILKKFDYSDIKEFTIDLRKFSSKFNTRMIPKIMDKFSEKIVEFAKQEVKVDTGELKKSIWYVKINTPKKGEEVRGFVSDTRHAIYQEEGFRSHFVPLKYIRGWAERHGKMDEAEKRGGLYVGARGKGRSYKPFIEPAARRAIDEVYEILDDIYKSLVEELR